MLDSYKFFGENKAGKDTAVIGVCFKCCSQGNKPATYTKGRGNSKCRFPEAGLEGESMVRVSKEQSQSQGPQLKKIGVCKNSKEFSFDCLREEATAGF